MDLSVSVLAIIILIPVFMVVGVWVYLHDGRPIFFSQMRVGKDGKNFKILKFRSMKKGAHLSELQVTAGSDPRITSWGKAMRAFKLDELPQLFNVVKGEMSIVGPRPEVPKYVAFYNKSQKEVLNFRPGITDPASIVFMNEEQILAEAKEPEIEYIKYCMPRKIEINLAYQKQANVFTDFIVLLKTVWKIVIRNTRAQ